MATFYLNHEAELYHYGVLGMKWGIRRYQNADGTLTAAGKKRYKKETSNISKSIKNELVRNGVINPNTISVKPTGSGSCDMTINKMAQIKLPDGSYSIAVPLEVERRSRSMSAADHAKAVRRIEKKVISSEPMARKKIVNELYDAYDKEWYDLEFNGPTKLTKKEFEKKLHLWLADSRQFEDGSDRIQLWFDDAGGCFGGHSVLVTPDANWSVRLYG